MSAGSTFAFRCDLSVATLAAALLLASDTAHGQQLLPAIGEFHGAGNITTSAHEADGALLVGGSFDRVGGAVRRNLVRFGGDGQLDAGWSPDPDNTVFDIAVDGSGRRYVSGRFRTIAGEPRLGLARFTADPVPVLDPGFVPELPPTIDAVDAIALRSDGTLYVSYCITSPSFSCAVARLDADGNRIAGFSTTTTSVVFPLTLSQDEASLFISGFSNQVNGTPVPAARGGLVKLDANTGAYDAAWAPFTSGSGRVRAIVTDGPGHLVVGGQIPGDGDGIARIDIAAGTADLGFGPDFGPLSTHLLTDVTRLPDGDLFVMGDFSTVDGAARISHVARLAPDGTPRVGWGDGAPTGGASTGSASVAPDGRVAISRIASPLFDETAMVELAAADGAATSTLAAAEFSARATFTRLLRQPASGRILAGGGAVREVEGRLSGGVVALEASLAPDAAWTSQLHTQVGLGGSIAMAVGAADVFVGGFGFNAEGGRTRGLYRLDGDDGASTAWVPAASVSLGIANDVPAAIALDEAGGHVYVAGLSNNASNQALPGRPLPRFALSDGLVDAGWTPTITGGVSTSALLLDGGFLYLAGFSTAGASDGSTVSALARFDVAGTGRADPGFKPFAAATSLRALASDAQFLYAGGVNALVRIDKASGLIDPDWSPLAAGFGTVSQLALLDDGGLAVTGSLAAGCGGAQIGIVRVQPDGAIDPRWRVDADIAPSAALGLDAGRVLIAGAFRSIDGEARDGIAAVGPSDTIFADSGGDPLCVN